MADHVHPATKTSSTSAGTLSTAEQPPAGSGGVPLPAEKQSPIAPTATPSVSLPEPPSTPAPPPATKSIDKDITAKIAEPKRTPAYQKSFEPNTDKIAHLLDVSRRATETYFPQLKDASTEISGLPVAAGVERNENLLRIVKEVSKQASDLTGGILIIHELMPVLTVTIVEAYLKDVLIYAAGIDDTLMAHAEQTASYDHIVNAGSIQELLDELRGKWARKFVDRGGPTEWIKRLETMGARGYDPTTSIIMEGLWGVRHLVVHSAGIVTPEFVRRHPSFQKKVGDRLIVNTGYFKQWFAAVYDFVQVTDLYFIRRCERLSPNTAN